MPRNATILGGSALSALGKTTFRSGNEPDFSGPTQLPDTKVLFESVPVPARFGRFDAYTRIGCAAITAALQDSDIQGERSNRGGIVIATGYECLQTDISYYATTQEANGAYTSPNLFSYTLPGIVIGESAILHSLKGPGFTVGQNNSGLGIEALLLAIDLLENDQAEFIIAGWLDAPPDLEKLQENLQGAAFLVLGGTRESGSVSGQDLSAKNGQLFFNQHPIHSIADFFKPDIA